MSVANTDEQTLYTAFQQLADVFLPLKQELRVRAHAMVGAFLGLAPASADAAAASAVKGAAKASAAKAGAAKAPARRSPPQPRPAPPGSLSPKDFLAEKKPTSDVERVACLGFYLTHNRATPHFKTVDINKLNTEAAQRKFTNAAATVGNATRLGYLATATKGMKRIAPEGEKYVQQLPDREAAKAAFRARKAKRQRQGGTGKAAAKRASAA